MNEIPHLMLGKGGIKINRTGYTLPEPEKKPEEPKKPIGLMQDKSTRWNPDLILKYIFYFMVGVISLYAAFRIVRVIYGG